MEYEIENIDFAGGVYKCTIQVEVADSLAGVSLPV